MHDELTQVDIDKMKEELQHRIQVLRPQLIEEVKVARSFGDLSENFEYKAAKREKNRNDSRIRYLQNMIKTAVVIDGTSQGEGIALFDKVTFLVEDDGTQETIRPSIPREEQTDLGIPTDHVLLIRVKGGVSYRGGVIDPLPGVPVPEGYWLESSPGSGIVLHVPTEEVEEVFGQ